ncbi:MAG: 16S rRNA (guanine(966)-N(2))-methyltransferase RsmD [Gammaproteobacteria bacterium]
MPPKPGRVRIIGGEWRSRVIPVPAGVELRPTTDRIRETLFNWLLPHIEEANCLDVCSGSGILAFEALSRGASHVTLIDNEFQVTKHLQQQAALFQTTQLDIICADVVHWLSKPATTQFTIAFIDPPFASQLWVPICTYLENNGWLAPEALIYLEMPAQQKLELPHNWRPLKQKRAGNVNYELWTN